MMFLRGAGPLVGLALLLGCGDSSAPRPPPTPPPSDSGPMDAPAVDADVDSGDDGFTCSTQQVVLAMDEARLERAVTVAPGPGSFLYAWTEFEDDTERLRLAEVTPGGPLGVMNIEAEVESVDVADEFAVWVERTEGQSTIRGMATDAMLPFRIQEIPEQVVSPIARRVVDDYWVAWLRQGDGRWRLEARRLSADAETEVIRLPWTTEHPHFAFAPTVNRLFFAWVSNGNAFVGVTDLNGESDAEPAVVSTESNASGEIELEVISDAGMVAFSALVAGVRPEIRARLLDGDGAPARPEINVSRSPLVGASPAVIAYQGGFAVAFRSSHNFGPDKVRLAFVHGSTSKIVDLYDLGHGGLHDGEIGLAVNPDGAIAVGFAHLLPPALGEGTAIIGARLECAEAWLRCSR